MTDAWTKALKARHSEDTRNVNDVTRTEEKELELDLERDHETKDPT